jgi:hypothetical protein
MQQGSRDGRCIELHFRENLGYFKRVDDVGLAGCPHLPFMVLDTELPRLADERHVFSGPVGLNVLQEGFKALID